jgi:hypothetical protein
LRITIELYHGVGYLRAEAARRGLDVHDLVRRVVTVVASDELVLSVLDDASEIAPLPEAPLVAEKEGRMCRAERRSALLRYASEHDGMVAIAEMVPQCDQRQKWYPALESLIEEGLLAAMPRAHGKAKAYYRLVSRDPEQSTDRLEASA